MSAGMQHFALLEVLSFSRVYFYLNSPLFSVIVSTVSKGPPSASLKEGLWLSKDGTEIRFGNWCGEWMNDVLVGRRLIESGKCQALCRVNITKVIVL